MDELYKTNNYPSAKLFYQILKENGIKKTHKEVEEFIKNQAVQQLHKPIRKTVDKQKFITASAPNEIWQIDLLDYQKYSRQNKGFNYILICVDIFSRKAIARPIISKHSPNTAKAFDEILNIAKPSVIYSDDGNEWRGKFKELIDTENIIQFVNDYGDHQALGIIDRFSQTLKRMIAKFMTAKNTKRWCDELENIIKIYNNTPHSGIENIKPKDALTGENKNILSNLNFEKQAHNKAITGKRQNIKSGDYVRVERIKGTFEKGYEITFSKDIYKVVSVTTTKAKLDNGEEYKFEKLMRVEKPPMNTKPEPAKVIVIPPGRDTRTLAVVTNNGGIKKYVRKINYDGQSPSNR